VGLIAREIERAGVPTLAMTSAWDITEAVAPPRSAYVHHPLGHQTGRPGDLAGQIAIVRAALESVARLAEPGEIAVLPVRWDVPGDEGWEARAYSPDHVAVPGDGKPDRGPAPA
jgi:D-proline reductase (dithiol) PrdB